MTLNHLKTNSAKFAHYILEIQKVLEFFKFRSLTQHLLWTSLILAALLLLIAILNSCKSSWCPLCLFRNHPCQHETQISSACLKGRDRCQPSVRGKGLLSGFQAWKYLFQVFSDHFLWFQVILFFSNYPWS